MELKSISIEYEDGNTRSIDSNSLDRTVYAALSSAGLCNPPAEISTGKHYLILEWQDGWKEVVAVDSEAASLIRYYIIQRVEDTGRIVLDMSKDYPRLITITRLPKELNQILIVNDHEVKAYTLKSEIESYEGIYGAGGKKEFRRYDRANPIFQEEFSQDQENLTKIKQSIAEAASSKGLSPEDLLGLDKDRRIQEYAGIAKMSGLMGYEKQSDVYGFIEMVLRNLTAIKA